MKLRTRIFPREVVILPLGRTLPGAIDITTVRERFEEVEITVIDKRGSREPQ